MTKELAITKTNNLIRGSKVGIYFGTFAPLHSGHQQEIYKAAALNDGVVVIVSGYTGDRGDNIDLGLQKRFRYLREAFADEPLFGSLTLMKLTFLVTQMDGKLG